MTIRSLSALLLACGVCACASDIWIKPGAGADALASDKATCRSEVATLTAAPAERESAFERCMEARDWWHVARDAEGSVAATEASGETPPEPESSALAAAGMLAPQRKTSGEPSPNAANASVADVASAPPAPQAAPTPARVDPAQRQFWFKLGAGTPQLDADQSACRAELGLDPTAKSPSRWGESADFDRCMRGRQWSGGSVEAR